MIKLEFITQYVEEGCLEPDEHGRWSINVYMFVSGKHLSQYADDKSFSRRKLPIKVACIYQNNSCIGNVPSTIHRFSAIVPSFTNVLEFGFGEQYIYDNDIDSLKKKVTSILNDVHSIFSVVEPVKE